MKQQLDYGCFKVCHYYSCNRCENEGYTSLFIILIKEQNNLASFKIRITAVIHN